MLWRLGCALQARHPAKGQQQRSNSSAWSGCWVLHLLPADW